MKKLVYVLLLSAVSFSGYRVAETIAQTQPNFGQVVEPGTSLNASVFNAVYPYGMTPGTIASFPACTVGNVGAHIFVNNATAPAFNTPISGAGAVYVEAH